MAQTLYMKFDLFLLKQGVADYETGWYNVPALRR